MASEQREVSPALREELIAAAHAAADAARKAILPHFRHLELAAENKAGQGFDPVTAADREAEAAMRAVLEAARPEDAILGEEFGPKPGRSGLEWVLDPIDGTRGFLSGTPTWGVLVAVRDAAGPLFGIIDQPYIGERFAGGFGVAEFAGPLGRERLATRHTGRLEEAILFTTFPEVGTPEEGAAFHRLSARCRLTRYGMDCYAYALVALGHVDLVVEAGLYPYDVQAPIAVIEAAGGIVTDWQGGPAHEGGRVLAAANRSLHAAALELLALR
ncbi:MAG: inositol monophosphatase family protein [Alphaproteobacteria bacterium]|nr:MAG: inositol monophosphatase family protein [Alphaproteobacteria bacterium]